MVGQVRPHQRPAHPGAIGDGLVDVGHVGDALGDHVHRLAVERRGQAVGEMPRDLLLHPDRHPLHLEVESLGPVHGLGRGPVTGHQLDHRHHVRRVHRVRHQNALGVAGMGLNVAGLERGRAGGDDHLGRDDLFEPGHKVLLDPDPVRAVLLHVDRAGECRDVGGDGRPRRGVGERQLQRREIGPGCRDEAVEVLDRLGTRPRARGTGWPSSCR